MALLFNTDSSNENNLPPSIRSELCYPGLYVFNPQPPRYASNHTFSSRSVTAGQYPNQDLQQRRPNLRA